MTLEEAAASAGEPVVYCPRRGTREDGTIVRVSAPWVFVDYGRGGVKATSPLDLELVRTQHGGTGHD